MERLRLEFQNEKEAMQVRNKEEIEQIKQQVAAISEDKGEQEKELQSLKFSNVEKEHELVKKQERIEEGNQKLVALEKEMQGKLEQAERAIKEMKEESEGREEKLKGKLQ